MTPTARTLAELRRRNWKAHGVVEQVVPRTFIKRDFLGVIDLIAVTPDGILGVQVTSGTNLLRMAVTEGWVEIPKRVHP